MYRILIIIFIMFSFQGCAHLTTYQADVGSPSTGVSFDAKQRLLLVNNVDNVRRMCAEPSPDALSALSASLGASVLGSGGGTKQLAAALGESSASIGLRTTSIQLLRDAMYRVCEAYLSKGITPVQYADLQGHAQTLVVGLLAIEQLTGAVQAQQVAVIGNAAAGGLPDVTAEGDNLIQAKKATASQGLKAEAALSAKAAAEKAEADKLAALNKAKANAATKPEDLKKLQEEHDKLAEDAKKAGTDSKSEADTLEINKQAEAIAQTAFDMAMSRVRASATGSVNFGQNTFSRGGISDANAATLAAAVTTIVTTVAGIGIETQKCLNSLLDPTFAKLEPLQKDAVYKLCNVVGQAEENRLQSLQRQQLQQLQKLNR